MGFEIINVLKREKGLTNAQLAKLTGVTLSTIDKITSGANKNPKLDTLQAICDVLGCTLNDFSSGAKNEKTAPSYTDEALRLAKDYDGLDIWGQRQVRSVADIEKARCEDVRADAPTMKIIPLISSGFAAGRGDPDFGNPWEDYEVPVDSKAEFAIHISGDSMEPYLHDGTVALCVKRPPMDGEVGAFLLDGDLLCKQICIDHVGNVYLFSLNRERADADRTIWHNDEHDFSCFGTVLMNKRVPLP